MVQFDRWKVILILAVCALGFVYVSPNLMQRQFLDSLPGWLPTKQLSLGLDLRGGAHLLLEAKVSEALKEGLENLTQAVRVALRKEKIGYTGIGTVRNGVGVTVLKQADLSRARQALRDVGPDMELKTAGLRLTLTYTPKQLRERQRAILEQAITIIGIRVNALGLTEPSIQRQGTDRILVQAPGSDPEALKKVIGKTAKMTFHLLDPEVQTYDPNQRARPGIIIIPGSEKDSTGRTVYYLVKKRVEVSGEDLVDSQPSVDRGRPVVTFRFNAKGARRFGNVTRNNVKKPFAIVLDKEVISAPVIQEPILGGSGQISGRFSTREAQNLALLLRSGALPVPLTIIEERSVGPSLGADSIRAGKIASVFALLVVVVFMALAYGMFGLMADVALLLNIVLIGAVLSVLQATLTLPGIAGIVLTIGMAVDANVLVFERIREEQRAGRTPISAVDSGYRRALKTIIDANVTTLIAAILLLIFGSGPVKGFGVTLAIGLVTSMFTAIWVTRLIVVLWLRRTRPKTLPI
jgi:preprotein translocase subunit SecD